MQTFYLQSPRSPFCLVDSAASAILVFLRSLRNMKFRILFLFIIGSFFCQIFATTWGLGDITCPICDTVNSFYVVFSYGSYIYQWESKYQFVFWPMTDPQSLYCCKNCRFTCFMGEFEAVPEDKHEKIRSTLDSLDFSDWPEDYLQIPMSDRLMVAEKMYTVIGQDDESWCHFYRIKGYHLQAEEKLDEAKAARLHALELVQKMMEYKINKGRLKELYLISGAMKYYTDDKEGALQDFKKAQKLTFKNDKVDEVQLKQYNDYLNGLLEDYVTKIEESK